MKDRYDISYIKVPYAQKDAAKALGARWDAIEKSWYVPKHLSMTMFIQWLPDHLKRPHNPVIDNMSPIVREKVKRIVDEHMKYLSECYVAETKELGECYYNGGKSPYWEYTNLITD
jgi:hypothetical protein